MPLQALEYALLFVLGAILGSFYNVVIYRLPRNFSIITPPSHCPHCKKKISWYDNIPIISYFLLRGRCRHCGASIPIRYPLVEAFSGFLAVLCKLKFQEPYTAFVFFVFFSILLVASFIDWDTFLLPDSLTIGGLVFGVLSSLFRRDFSIVESLAGALVGGGLFLTLYLYYVKVRKVEGLGFGDVKLMAFIGSVAGIWGVMYAVFLGSIFGLLYALPIIIKNRTLQFAVPFGPFLSLGVFVGVLLDLRKLLF